MNAGIANGTNGSRSILLVEDEAMIGMMLEDYLDMLGYRLHALATSVDEACDHVRQGGFDAALLDCNLRGEKAWPIADLLTEQRIPFIFATGGSADELPTRYVGQPTLAKPFTIGAVERALERIWAAS